MYRYGFGVFKNDMLPMNRTFTHFISFKDLTLQDIDLVEDAYGYTYAFNTVFSSLPNIDFRVSDQCIDNLLLKAGIK